MDDLGKQNMQLKSHILSLTTNLENDRAKILELRQDSADLQDEVTRLENESQRIRGELSALELASQQQQDTLQRHIAERNTALQEERESVRELKVVRLALQANVRTAMHELERRRRDVSGGFSEKSAHLG